jgi:hypothetical protein
MSAASVAPGRRFLNGFAAAALVALALWMAIVLAFDPYLAFGTRLVPRAVIQPDSRMLGDEQLIKDHLFRRLRPETVIIGSSRSVYGLDPDGPALAGARAFNLSMLGAGVSDLDGLAAQVRNARPHVRRLVMGVDYFMFFQPEPEGPVRTAVELRRRRMEVGRGPLPIPLAHVQSFLISTKLGRVIEDILANWRRKDNLGEAALNGLMHGTYRFRIADRSRTFEVTLRSLFEQNWYAPPDEARIRARLQRIAGILRRSCEAGIKVDVILSPEHAMLHEAALLTGQRERREQLRRDMARLIDLMRREQPDCLRYRDASGLSEPAMEPLRLPQGAAPQFIEVSHYAPAVGERVLRGFARADDPQAIGLDPAGGGLEADIAATRTKLEEWRRANPDDAAFVRRIHDGAMRVRPNQP